MYFINSLYLSHKSPYKHNKNNKVQTKKEKRYNFHKRNIDTVNTSICFSAHIRKTNT